MKLNGLEKYFETVEGEIIDFKQVKMLGYTPLNFAFYYIKSERFNLNEKQWNYLIQNSDLRHINQFGWSPLMYALKFKGDNFCNLNKEQWKYMIENSDLSLIKDKDYLIELKKIQSELLNNEILNKIKVKEVNKKENKL